MQHVGANMTNFHVAARHIAFFCEFDGHFGDFAGFIANTLKIGIGFGRRYNQTQITGRRLA